MSTRKIEIKLPDYLKPGDQEVWNELETYLYVGFLTSNATIYKKGFIFKTVNLSEIQQINWMRTSMGSADVSSLMSKAIFVAFSILYMEGNNILINRDQEITRIVKTILKFNPAVLDKIVEDLNYLNRKALRLHPLVEVYCYESRSRFKWFQSKKSPIHHSINTGLPGTENIGVNQCQQTWTALNHVIDKKEEIEREWSNAKFIGGCMAGKGIRSVDEKDRARLDREKQEREDKKLEVLRDYLSNSTGSKPGPILRRLPNGQLTEIVGKYSAESREELADQLSAAMSGDKDIHDLIVEQHTEKLRKAAQEIESDKRRLLVSPGMSIGNSEGSRILGEKKNADALIDRLRMLKESNRDQISRRLNGSDPSDSDRNSD